MNQTIVFCAEYLIYISALYAVAHVIWKHEKRHHIKRIVIILGTAILAWIIAHILKDIIVHPRPDSVNFLVKPDSLYSFPSGHATFMFALAWSMYGFDKCAGKFIFILATITGIARVLAGVHFWYDIIGGFFVGGIIAYLILLITKRIRS